MLKTSEDLEIYEEELEEVIEEYVEELATEELVVVVEQVAEVSIQNLAVADTQTQKVVQAVVSEVTSVETVAELNEEQKEAVGEVLGFVEESAAEDVEIIAQQAAKDENTAQAVEEFVERAIENKEKYSGCTVHYVNSKLDSGKIILQKKVKIFKNDTPKSLAERILKQEHLLYKKAIKKIYSTF